MALSFQKQKLRWGAKHSPADFSMILMIEVINLCHFHMLNKLVPINVKFAFILQFFRISSQAVDTFSKLVALPFPKREGEVGCEALSSSQHQHWQSNNMRADDAETPPGMQRQSIDSLRQTKHCCKDLSHCSPCLQHQSRMLRTLQHIIRLSINHSAKCTNNMQRSK